MAHHKRLHVCLLKLFSYLYKMEKPAKPLLFSAHLYEAPLFWLLGVIHKLHHPSQCVPGFSNPNQKVHELFHFYIAVMYKTDQNQLKKKSVIRLPKFSINTVEKCHQWASFTKENLFFEDYCFGSLIKDVFFNWFWSVLYITAI